MPKAKYTHIYKDLKEKIETEAYSYQEMLPSENTLVLEYDCSRNTVRPGDLRADCGRLCTALARQGSAEYLPTCGTGGVYRRRDRILQGIFRPQQTAKVLHRSFSLLEITADEKIENKDRIPKRNPALLYPEAPLSERNPSDPGSQLFSKRSRHPGSPRQLPPSPSMNIWKEHWGLPFPRSKRTLTVEHVTQVDEKYIDLKGYNCMAVITSQTFDDNGIQFEYTQSRHHPDFFQFQDVATRKMH